MHAVPQAAQAQYGWEFNINRCGIKLCNPQSGNIKDLYGIPPLLLLNGKELIGRRFPELCTDTN